MTRGDAFPTAPDDGDEHFLTTNLYPDGTTFTTSPVPRTASGTGNQVFEQLTATDPVTNERIIAGTVPLNQENVPAMSFNSPRTLPGGVGTTFRRDFVRDLSLIHI